MVFSCAPNFRAKAAAKKQALKQKLAGAGAYHGVSLRLLLVDKQVDEQDVLPHAALGCVHVVKYDAHSTTLAELVALIREAHRQNGAPFLSMAIAQHGADSEGQWEWTTDLTVNLKSVHGAIDQLAPIVEVLAAALSKTKAGKAHIDLLACNLATTCKGLVPALEKMYGIDFRASTDETGNDLSGGDWKMETDNDYDVAADYLDAAKLKAYTETMAIGGKEAKAKAKNNRAVNKKMAGYAKPMGEVASAQERDTGTAHGATGGGACNQKKVLSGMTDWRKMSKYDVFKADFIKRAYAAGMLPFTMKGKDGKSNPRGSMSDTQVIEAEAGIVGSHDPEAFDPHVDLVEVVSQAEWIDENRRATTGARKRGTTLDDLFG